MGWLCCQDDQLGAHPEFENWWLGINQLGRSVVNVWMKTKLFDVCL
jgi:hypothetical protein